MYSRQYRTSKQPNSEPATTSQFARKPFTVQPQPETSIPEQTPDSQTQQEQAKLSQSNWPDVSMFTYRPPTAPPPRVQPKRNIDKLRGVSRQENNTGLSEVRGNPTQDQFIQNKTKLPLIHQVSQTTIQRLPVKINGQLIDVKKTNLANDENVEALFNRLGLTIPDNVKQDQNSTLSDKQKQLNKLAAAVDTNSINKDVFLNVISQLIDGKEPDWTAWDELEKYQHAVQPVIDERDDIKADSKKDKSTYFQWYSQNLKDKGMDYEKLINDFVKNNSYGMGLAEAHAIFGYTTILFYTKLNELLRKGIKEDKTALLKALLENALNKLPISQETQYRGMNIESGAELNAFLNKYKVNTVITDNQFNSAAKDKIQPFWNNANIRFTINLSKARNISEIAFGTHFIEILSEGKKKNDTHESLFLPNAKFLVKSINPENEERSETNKQTKQVTTKNVTVYNIVLEQIE
jgi:hypothetical protein